MLGIFQLIAIALILVALAILINLLLKKTIKDEKKRKTFSVLADILLVLVTAAVFYGIISGFDAFGGGKKLQKEWIYNTLPKKLWEEQTTDLADVEYKRVVKMLEDQANAAIRKFDQAGTEKDLDEYMAMSLFGLDDLYLLGGGSSSSEKKREAQIERYKEQYETVTDNLRDNMSKLLRLRDSTLSRRPAYSDGQLFHLLLGTPDAIASPSAALQESIARSLVSNQFLGREKPHVASATYDRKEKVWHVRMDSAPNQEVRFFKRDDDGYDIEWTGNKGFVPAASAPVPAAAADDEDPEEEWAGRAEPDFRTLGGYLEDENGKQYKIRMELMIQSVADEDDSFGVSGSYQYLSQESDKRILLDGSMMLGERGLLEMILTSLEETERFDLFLDAESDGITGFWYQYKDKESCRKGTDDFSKRLKVVLREE